MVQEMNILRCYSCQTFQVHIVKKANKWQCKICNEKQSIQHVYYQGSGQDCRLQVQHLNFMRHIKDQQSCEKLENIEVFEERDNSVGVIDKPVITHSKWAKYMIPQKEFYENISNDDEGEYPSYNWKENTSRGSSNSQDHLTDNKKSIDEKFIVEEETGGSLPFTNNFSQNFDSIRSKRDNKIVSSHTTRSFQSSNVTNKNSESREGDFLLMAKSNHPCNTLNTGSSHKHDKITNRSKTELKMDEEDHGPSSSKDYSCDLTEKKQSTIIIRKHAKRKFYNENIVAETESNSSLSEPAVVVMFKRSKLFDESLSRKQNLRDIVGMNRSKTGRSVEKISESSGSGRDSNLVLKEIHNNSDIGVYKTEISKPDSKRKTIFETDCDDLDEILDF